MQKGFTLLFAILVSSIILAIGMGIFNVAVREIALSAAGRDSQIAFYLADTGTECAFFWDRKHPGFTYSVFQFPNNFGDGGQQLDAPTSGVPCAGQDIAATGGMPSYSLLRWPNTGSTWQTEKEDFDIGTYSVATTTFILSEKDSSNRKNYPCAKVEVVKKYYPVVPSTELGYWKTKVISEGYSVCEPLRSSAIQRTIEVDY